MCTFLHSSTYLVAPALKMKIAWNCILPPTYTLRILFFIYCHYKLGNDSMAFTINKHLYHRFRKVHLNVPLELFNMVWFAFSLRNDFCLRKYFFSHRYWTSTLQVLKAVKTFFGYFSFCEKYILKECLQCKLPIFTFLSKHSIHIYKKSTKTLLFVISFLSWMHCKVMQYISCFNTL